MMKKKGLAKRKMQAEKRLGKSLKVPMVKRTVPADEDAAVAVPDFSDAAVAVPDFSSDLMEEIEAAIA